MPTRKPVSRTSLLDAIRDLAQHAELNIDTISILGTGWLGLPLAKRFVARGYPVNTSTTSPERLAMLQALPSDAWLVDTGKGFDDVDGFFQAKTLVINITSKDIEGFTRLLRRVEQSVVERLLFVSSTSVYPPDSGFVSETDGKEDPGHPLVVIENLFRQSRAFHTTVVRFAGLVGGSRHPGRFFRGGKTVRNADANVNLIHLDDCLDILERIVVDDYWGETFNACGDTHPSKREFYTRAARLAGMPIPSFEDSDETSFKVVDNRKLKRVLDYELHHPDLMALRFDKSDAAPADD